MNQSPASILVVIVNYRTAALTIGCLRSLVSEIQGHLGSRVSVVDNASGDGSADAIAAAIESEGWSSWVTLLRAPLNGGFSYGNNFAIRPALASNQPPDFVWLLNPDTVVRPGAMDALASFALSHPDIGIFGGGVDDPDDSPWPFAFRFPSVLSEFEAGIQFGPMTRLLAPWMVLRRMNNHPERVDWISGASMMVRREVFEKIGLMDEDYFLYYEETDFCLQAKRAGWECWYVPASRVIHIAGASTGVVSRTDRPKRLPGYWFDSRRRYFIKNHGRLYAIWTDTLWMLAFSVGRFRRWLQRRPDTDPPHYLTDFFHHSSIRKSCIEGGVVKTTLKA